MTLWRKGDVDLNSWKQLSLTGQGKQVTCTRKVKISTPPRKRRFPRKKGPCSEQAGSSFKHNLFRAFAEKSFQVSRLAAHEEASQSLDDRKTQIVTNLRDSSVVRFKKKKTWRLSLAYQNKQWKTSVKTSWKGNPLGEGQKPYSSIYFQQSKPILCCFV